MVDIGIRTGVVVGAVAKRGRVRIGTEADACHRVPLDLVGLARRTAKARAVRVDDRARRDFLGCETSASGRRAQNRWSRLEIVRRRAIPVQTVAIRVAAIEPTRVKGRVPRVGPLLACAHFEEGARHRRQHMRRRRSGARRLE
jgi:hypothetical protein